MRQKRESPRQANLTGRSEAFGRCWFGSAAERRERNADAADVLEAGLALARRVVQAEGLAGLDDVCADVAVVLCGGELVDVAVVDDRGLGVIHYALLLQDGVPLRGRPYGDRV